MSPRLRLQPLLVLAAVLLVSGPAASQYGTESESDGYGIRQSVARVSYVEGEVSFNRGDAPDDWQPVSTNYPMTLGDRIWAGPASRVELQMRGANAYLGPESELAALDLTRDVRQFSLAVGTASFRVSRLDREDVFEVATPNVSVTFETPGIYRVDVEEDGDSRVSVLQGRASAASAGGQVELERGDQMRVRGIDRPDYDVVGIARADPWDRWVERRARRFRDVASYVHPDVYGVHDLDEYGTWERTPEYGFVWYPGGVSEGWEPYRDGRWIWCDPWGWTWLSSEPWGWAPYHFGRWAVIRGRWGWVPVGPEARSVRYSPAIVGFVGGGSGTSFSLSVGGFVGWFPIGPREPFEPWWRPSQERATTTSFDYAYRNRAIVVSRDVFVRSEPVEGAVVRDARVTREVATAPVQAGPIPVLPTRESIRVSPFAAQGRAAAGPPERIGRREVVIRASPPPAPPSFDRKLEVIRERGGAAVSPDVAQRLSEDENRGEKVARPVRPAARPGGGVQLAPRGAIDPSRRPQPLPPSADRPRMRGDRPTGGREETRPEAPPVRERAATPDVETAPAPERSRDRIDPNPAGTEPERVDGKKTAPGRSEAKAKPKPKKGKGQPDREEEPDGKKEKKEKEKEKD